MVVIASIAGLVVAVSTGSAFSASRMVEKHLFLPSPPSSGEEKNFNAKIEEVERKLAFTGTLLSDKGRFAFIRTKANVGDDRRVVREGATMRGYTIETIESNYIIVSAKGERVKLKLFSDKHNRPKEKGFTPAAGTTNQQADRTKEGVSATNAQAGQAANKSGKGNQSSGSKQKEDNTIRVTADQQRDGKVANPFKAALQKALKKAEKNRGQSNNNTFNPFMKAIQKAQEKGNQ